jgi:hypothetical protein
MAVPESLDKERTRLVTAPGQALCVAGELPRVLHSRSPLQRYFSSLVGVTLGSDIYSTSGRRTAMQYLNRYRFRSVQSPGRSLLHRCNIFNGRSWFAVSLQVSQTRTSARQPATAYLSRLSRASNNGLSTQSSWKILDRSFSTDVPGRRHLGTWTQAHMGPGTY